MKLERMRLQTPLFWVLLLLASIVVGAGNVAYAQSIELVNSGGNEGVEHRQTFLLSGFTTPTLTAKQVVEMVESAAPDWVTIVGLEVVINPPFGTVPAGDPFQALTFKITATEGSSTASGTFIFTLVASSGPPAATSGDTFFTTRQEVIAGQSTVLDAISHVTSNPTVASSQLVGGGNPTWVVVNTPDPGQFTVNPPATALGEQDISFQFCNQNNATSCTNFTLQLSVVDEPTDPDTTNPAIADAGPDQTVSLGAAVTLAGSVPSTPAFDYRWTQTGGTDVALTGANTLTPSFTAPTAAGVLVFQLMVTEARLPTESQPLVTGTDSVIITVGIEEPAGGFDPLQLSAKRLTVVLGETREVTISGALPPYRAAFISGDLPVARATIVDVTTLRITGLQPGQARLHLRDFRSDFSYLQVRVIAPPLLNFEADDGSATEALFRGGASSDGDNYFKDAAFSVGEALGIVFVITPRASDVDKRASVVIAARMRSDPENVWLLTESGLLPYDGELLPFKEGLTLETNNFIDLIPEPVRLSLAEVGSWELFIGYQLADGTLFYHPQPLGIEVVE